MNEVFDVIIIGSGPAGVSAAFPLLEAGLKVLMVDGGKTPTDIIPTSPFLEARKSDVNQIKWLLGDDFMSLRGLDLSSPKFRVPNHQVIFEHFKSVNKIQTNNFISVGSLATGGLSNAWGCGVAKYSPTDLNEFPFEATELENSYQEVAKRVGISGAFSDDLNDYLGLDAYAEPPIDIDDLNSYVFEKYMSDKALFSKLGIKIGHVKVAALKYNLEDRLGCNLCGNCLWGCRRSSLYSAANDVSKLKKYKNFQFNNGFIVEEINKTNDYISILGVEKNYPKQASAKKVFLAAGTLASTRLALAAIKYFDVIELKSNPTAAFMLWLPKFIGTKPTQNFGLGQIGFTIDIKKYTTVGFGTLFNPTGIPFYEFIRHAPISKKNALNIFSKLMPSCLVGNVFLSGEYSDHKAQLNHDQKLQILGGHKKESDDIFKKINHGLNKALRTKGIFILPGSFKVAKPGADVHYAATLPMRKIPKIYETNYAGELQGMKGLYVVDGSCFSNLIEKPHTLTIMANANRIAKLAIINFNS